MRVRYFGEPWPSREGPAPICGDVRWEVPAPVGEICIGCKDAVVDGDRGLVMAASTGITHSYESWIDEVRRRVCAYHVDCHLTNILGPEWRELIARSGGEPIERRPADATTT